MPPGRIVIGGTDVTDEVAEWVAAAPPFSSQQRELLRGLLRPDAAVTQLRPRRSVSTQRAA